MTEPNLHLVPGADEPKCLPTVPIVTLADVLGASFATVSLNSRALILAIAAHSEAEIVFEFGPRGSSHGLDICEHMGDGTISIAHDTSPRAELTYLQGRDIASTLTPEAIAKTEVLTHVDWLHGKHARLEYAPWLGACDLVLVDASQAYDYVKCDSLTAFHLTKPGGTVLWTNYETAPGVTRCLNELHRSYRCFRNLRRIADTQVCYWRNV